MDDNAAAPDAVRASEAAAREPAARQAWWRLAPFTLARFGVLAAILLVAGYVWVTISLPGTDTQISALGADQVVMAGPSGSHVVNSAARVQIDAAGGSTELPASSLVGVSGIGSDARVALAGLLADGPVELSFVDSDGLAQRVGILPAPVGAAGLPADFWLTLVLSLFSAVFGIAIWAVRPHDRAAGSYAFAGVFMLLTTMSDVAMAAFSIATPAWIVWTASIANIAAIHPFALSFVVLFACFPAPLLRLRSVLVPAGLAVGAMVVLIVVRPVWADAVNIGLLGLEYLVMLVVLVAQFWSGRKDPERRPALAILLGTILSGVVLYMLVELLPLLGLMKEGVTQAAAFPLFTLIFAGIGVAIARQDLLALDGWARNIMMSVAFLAGVLIIDAVLLGLVTRQQDVALGLSLALVALVYFPLREWLSRRRERRRRRESQQVLRLAADLAFATSPAARADRWKSALQASFRPLAIELDPEPVAAACVARNGRLLRLPPLAGAPGLYCRHADLGRRGFGRDDVEAAEALGAMVERLVEARDAYVKGVREERQRIARDLHDDVSGRLMISLHRDEAGAMRQDVREAMADIRTIVTGLAGGPRLLGDLLADLRDDCASRCEAAGMTLDWPPGDSLSDPLPLDYAVYRQLMAMVRECVSNAIRHSGGTRIAVDITRSGARLTVHVRDDGTGLQAATGPAPDGSGHGLANCNQRAAALDGVFRIIPENTGGHVMFDISLVQAAG